MRTPSRFRTIAVAATIAAALAIPAGASAADALGAGTLGSALAAHVPDALSAPAAYAARCYTRSYVTYRYGQRVVVTKRVCTPVYRPVPRCYTRSYVTYNRYGQKIVTTKRVCS